MGTLEDLDEGYDPNYTGLSDFQKQNPIYNISFYESDAPKRNTFDHIYMKELNTITTICFETLVKAPFYAKSYNSS